ncbi:MAG TPA: LamG-like jellyroll fold domain-containing protein [Vicinamibacterales bacterium]
MQSVTDTRGNVYARAVGPTVSSGLGTQSIYYARNITAAAAGTNVVTVVFTPAAQFADVRIAEYRGLDPTAPLDVAVGAQGTGTTASSGSVTTRYANDLLVGANLVAQGTLGAGTGYASRIVTTPDGDILEDRTASTVGSYSATARLTGGAWVMQVVAFRPSSGSADTQPPSTPAGLTASSPSATQVGLAWTASTDNVAVSQYLIERCQGAGCSTFAQVGTSTAPTYSDATVAASTTYQYRVRASDSANNLSGYSNVASVTTPTAPDTAPPSAPSALTAALSTSQINLAWTASTDNVGVSRYLVERCQGAGCSTFAQVGTATAVNYSDTTVVAGTTYQYRVRASDAANNLSGYSNSASVTTPPAPDTAPPSAPSALTATASSTSQITLAWTGSTDNVGVSSYVIERCQGTGCSTYAQVGTATAPGYSDTTVAASTTYQYRVRASDAANNLSAYSNIAAATTPAPADTAPPTAPTSLTATAISASQMNLTWTASTDNVGVTAYQIERCTGSGCAAFVQIATATASPYSDTTVAGGTSYSYRIRATDLANNQSGYSAVVSATTPAAAPIGFVQMAYATPQSTVASVNVAFPAAQTAGDLSVVVVGWNDAVAQVQSVADSRGNIYTKAVGPTVRSGLGTQSIYYAPNIASAPANGNTVTVTFSRGASHPDIRIAEYRGLDAVAPLDAVAAATGSTTPSNSGTLTTRSSSELLVGANLVAQGTTAAGSGFTNRVVTNPDGDILEDRIVTTVGTYSAAATLTGGAWVMQLAAFKAGGVAVDSQPPTAPGNATATTASTSQVNVTWTASVDNVGVTAYRVERCAGSGCTTFTEIGTTSGALGLNDTGLSANTSYSYRIRAGDQAGNLSVYSNTASAVTSQALDSEPPSAPGPLTATALSGTQVSLNWSAATDNVGVTGYRIERCQGVGCTTFIKLATPTGTTFTDTGLTPNTTYNYVALATDAAGNLGPYSNMAAVTTTATVPELVAAYSFNDGSGSTALDSSGTGNTATIGSATWSTAGKFGGALSFSGSARVVVPDSPSLHLSTALTLEAWVNPTAVSSAWRDVVYKGNDNYYLEATTDSGGRPGAGVTLASSGNSNTYAPAVLSPNTWTHLAETYDGTTVRLYVNGVQVAASSLSGPLASSTSPLEIGGDSIYGQYFQGLIDEVRVYNVARTPAQIQSDMSSPVGASVPVVVLSNSSIDFGQQAIGVPAPTSDLTVTNVGTAPLNFTAISTTGSQAAEFSRTTTCGTALAAGSSCSVTVTFTPAAAGARSGILTIQDDAAGAPQVITLSGQGVSVLLSPATVTLTPNRPVQFSAISNGSSTYVWSVDGVAGGTSASGTITADGLYTAPSTTGSHTVSATTTDQSLSGSATVFVVNYTGTFTFHNDNGRTGANLNETVLAPANVNSSRFGKLRSYAIDGISMASPLYVPAVTVPGIGVRNVVYVATEHDSVYAFDADGNDTNPLWQVSFVNPAAGVTTVSPADVNECCDIAPEIGITGTPVIDAATGTLYVVAKTAETIGSNKTFVQRLHALDVTTGAEKFGGPVVIQASVPGTGTGSAGGRVAFDALHENQRPALLLNNGVVYVAFGSHGDIQPYHGWVLGYNAATLQQTFAYCVSPDAEGGGIWLANSGLAADANGSVFLVTGNGTFDGNSGGTNFGDSYIKLGPAGAFLDYFTPHNEGTLDGANADLGAGGITLLPDQSGTHPHLLVSAGKNGTIDVIDRDNMGHYHAADDSQIVQSLANIFPFGTPEPGNYSAPIYYNGVVYFSPVSDNLQAFALTNGRLSTSPTSRASEIFAYPGGTLAVSAAGNVNGILWAIERRGTASGALHAYDASNLGNELYHSDQAGSRDVLDEAVKFSAPLVANGRVYVASATRLTIYGLFQ